MKIRVRKADVIFSKLVRTRSNWTCESCGIDKSCEPETFDCCHIMGRRSVALRWHPDNALGMCRKCHMFFTEHPFDWSDFCRERFGEERVAELRLISNKPVKWSKAVREDIYTHMKDNLKRGIFERYEIMHEFTDAD